MGCSKFVWITRRDGSEAAGSPLVQAAPENRDIGVSVRAQSRVGISLMWNVLALREGKGRLT